MSRELQASLRAELDQGDRPKRVLNRQQFITTSGNNHSTGNIRAIGTTVEEIALPSDMATPQVLYVENMDDTNFVIIGATSTVSAALMPIKLFPKDSGSGINWGWIPWRGGQVNASADTAAIDLYYEIYES